MLAATAGCAGDVDTEESENQPTEQPTTQTPEGPTTHEIGESFTVGSGAKTIEYSVTDLKLAAEGIGSSMLYTEPDGIFVVVILEMENVGSETIDITTNHLQLVDEEGRTFDADTEALTYATNDDRIEADSLTFDQLQPGLSVTRSVIYDVPRELGYGLLIEPAGVLSTAESHIVPLGQI